VVITPRILRMNHEGKSRCAQEAAAVLRRGGLVVAPTDTLYGLFCSFTSEVAVKKIYSVKGRDLEKRLIALVPDIETAEGLSSEPLPGFVLKLWPGPLTIILPASSCHPYGWKTQAVRVPKSSWLQSLLFVLEDSIFAPSANPQGAAPALCIEQAITYFGVDVDLYIDGGKISDKIVPSTIVGWQKGGWRLFREGAVAVDQLQDGLM